MIRIDNLRLHMSLNNLEQADLSRMLGMSDSYISALLSGKKPFGERTARKIEELLGMHSKWLDEPRLIGDDPSVIDGTDLVRESVEKVSNQIAAADRASFSPMAMHLAMNIDKICDPADKAKAFAAAIIEIQRVIDGGK